MTATSPDVTAFRFPENNGIPNHPHFPALFYHAVTPEDDGRTFEKRFRENGWGGIWRWGVYPFHHFHSTAHEVLGVAKGSARLRLGGEDGETLQVAAGDMILLPAGTGHQCVEHSEDFEVVGAYPAGRSADLLRAGEDLDAAKRRIASVPIPSTDPLFGSNGPLSQHWKKPTD